MKRHGKFWTLAFLGLIAVACFHFWPHESRKVADKVERAAKAAVQQATK